MRNGKIAKLPGCVRKELNERMDNGESGTAILEWLNGVPRVREIIAGSFEGVPISKQNLSEWRQGGFQEWEIRQELYHEAGESLDVCDKIDVPLLISNLLAIIMARYAGLMNRWDGGEDPQFEAKVRVLRGLLRDFVMVQRAMRPNDKVETKKHGLAKPEGVAGMLDEFTSLLKLARKEAPAAKKSGAVDRSGGTPSGVTGTVALPGTGSGTGSGMEEVLAKVVELKMQGAAKSGLVKPGQAQSNQKLDFSAATDAQVYAQRISP